MDKIKSHLFCGGRVKPATLFVFKEGSFIKMNERGLNQSLSHLLLQGIKPMGCLLEAVINRGQTERLAEKIFKVLLASLEGGLLEFWLLRASRSRSCLFSASRASIRLRSSYRSFFHWSRSFSKSRHASRSASRREVDEMELIPKSCN